jgi:hypothetical protein
MGCACLVCRPVESVYAQQKLAQPWQLRQDTEELCGDRLARARAAQVNVPKPGALAQGGKDL